MLTYRTIRDANQFTPRGRIWESRCRAGTEGWQLTLLRFLLPCELALAHQQIIGVRTQAGNSYAQNRAVSKEPPLHLGQMKKPGSRM